MEANERQQAQAGDSNPGTAGRMSHWCGRDLACSALDLAALSLAFALAFLARHDGQLPAAAGAAMAWNLPWVVLLQYALLSWQDVPRFSWVFIGVRDLPPMLKAIGLSAAVMLLASLGLETLAAEGSGLRHLALPFGVVVYDAGLAVFGVAGLRALRRLHRQRQRALDVPTTAPERRAVLIGAGVAGHMLLQELDESRRLGFRPVAFVDDDPQKRGRLVRGVAVEGTTEDLTEVARRHGAEIALITIADKDPATLRRIVARCSEAGLQAKTVPSLAEILSGSVRISAVRDVRIEELLGREPVAIERSAAPAALAGKTALVTGAGGSIGSELCRQILALGPRRLVLVERCENALYEIHRELDAGDGRVIPEIADVTDGPRMQEVFALHRPDAVFHAAAHKHVPMMERVPREAVKNNVFGTKQVVDLAVRHKVERFVFVSTDKAVRPSSVMGACKRLAELYVREQDGKGGVRCASVRFGNVMGSAGSVIPLFREQIARGGPVTVTHPDMERFFMTIPEAARLVLEAAGLCQGGEVMVLDMGSPVKIRALAENLIRLSGFEPYRQIEIVFTGMRPGEKLHEELALPEETLGETACSKIAVWRGGGPSRPIDELLAELLAAGEGQEPMRAALHAALPEFRGIRPAQSAVVEARKAAVS